MGAWTETYDPYLTEMYRKLYLMQSPGTDYLETSNYRRMLEKIEFFETGTIDQADLEGYAVRSEGDLYPAQALGPGEVMAIWTNQASKFLANLNLPSAGVVDVPSTPVDEHAASLSPTPSLLPLLLLVGLALAGGV